MEQVPWSEDEWRQLTEGDEPVRHDPWGEPLTKTHPEALQDADYIARKLLDIAAVYAGPLGWGINYAVPRQAPGSETMRKVDTGMDYVGTFLGPLMALLSSRQYIPNTRGQLPGQPTRTRLPYDEKPDYTRENDTLDTLERLRNMQREGNAPWKTPPSPERLHWDKRWTTDVGGRQVPPRDPRPLQLGEMTVDELKELYRKLYGSLPGE